MKNLFSTDWSVTTLMEHFRDGSLAIPEIQRDLVWDSDQVKELFDSINEGFPCGSLILWEPRLRDEQLLREIIRPERLAYYNGQLPQYFLIDGQQRVTALASVLLEPGFIKNVEPEIEDDLGALYVNLKRFPQEVESSSDGSQYSFPWVRLHDLFDVGSGLRDSADYKTLPTATRQEIDRYAQRVRDYSFPIQIVKERDYPTVGRIFSRVNSQGTQLTGAEIHVASIIPYWKGISAEFRKFRHELRKGGYDLDLTFMMRSITVLACDVPQIKKLADRVSQQQLKQQELNKTWRNAKRAISKVVRTLKGSLLLDKTKFFPSKNALIPLVYYAAKGGKKLRTKAMMKCFLVSQLGGHYSRAGEGVLKRDLRYLSEPDISLHEGLDDLLDDVTRQAKQDYRGLKIRSSDVSGPASRNALLLMMYVVMRQRGASDFGVVEPRGLEEIPGDEVELHHIFPFDFMMKDEGAKKYREKCKLSLSDFRWEVNDIANITFLSKTRNASVKNGAPWQYLPNETTPAIRNAHFIPNDPGLWKPEAFDKFCEARRALLAKAMNTALKQLS